MDSDAASDAATPAGSVREHDRAAGTGGPTEVAPGHAGDTQSGVADLLDDLAGRPGPAADSPAESTGLTRQASTDDADATSAGGNAATERAHEVIQQGRDRASATAGRVEASVDDAATDLKETVGDALGQIRGAGSDMADSVREAGKSTRDDVAAAAGQVGERTQAAGKDVAAAVEDGIEQAGDRVERAAGDIAEITQAAAGEVSGAVGRAVDDIREQVAMAAQDVIGIGRDTAAGARVIATDTTADVRSGIADAAGSIAETGRTATGAVASRASEAARTLTGTAIGAASGLASTVRSGIGGADPVAGNPADSVAAVSQHGDHNRTLGRFIVSAVAVGTVSGFNRWAVRRLTGADIALLGPSTVHPAILGTGLATLIASLYLTEN